MLKTSILDMILKIICILEFARLQLHIADYDLILCFVLPFPGKCCKAKNTMGAIVIR